MHYRYIREEKIMFEKAFVYNPADRERPVHFGFSPEEREYLKKERSVEEIMAFIKENELGLAVTDVKFNNDFGFGWFPAQGEISRQPDGCVFHITASPGEECRDLFIGKMTDEEWADYRIHRKDARYAVVFISEEGEDEARIHVLMSTDPSDKNEPDFMSSLDNAVTEILIQHAGIDTYHKLGKLINRARRIVNEERKAQEKYPLPEGIYPWGAGIAGQKTVSV